MVSSKGTKKKDRCKKEKKNKYFAFLDNQCILQIFFTENTCTDNLRLTFLPQLGISHYIKVDITTGGQFNSDRLMKRKAKP